MFAAFKLQSMPSFQSCCALDPMPLIPIQTFPLDCDQIIKAAQAHKRIHMPAAWIFWEISKQGRIPGRCNSHKPSWPLVSTGRVLLLILSLKDKWNKKKRKLGRRSQTVHSANLTVCLCLSTQRHWCCSGTPCGLCKYQILLFCAAVGSQWEGVCPHSLRAFGQTWFRQKNKLGEPRREAEKALHKPWGWDCDEER